MTGAKFQGGGADATKVTVIGGGGGEMDCTTELGWALGGKFGTALGAALPTGLNVAGGNCIGTVVATRLLSSISASASIIGK